ncbi:MAG: FAD-dependent oxidoreductase, partial [Candidatus Zophobacter franzmannii]|nr:FAD-dependent oxidoreductase [Candidatus Zophobacter franzmannii]
MINIKLNGKDVQVECTKTILAVCEEHGIEIPTLCHDEELKPFGSCWVCAVKLTGRPGFVTACGTNIHEGMAIETSSDEVLDARKTALELLLSDHYADCEAPCKVACPAHVDVQSYVSLIANGQYSEAVRVIKDSLPMPLSIGRVCPAFCEGECRRELVDESIAIRQLKRHTADIDLIDPYIPTKLPSKGKKVAIIGAGPSGLSAGYYLSNWGYDVKVFEAEDKGGGWLRYGIPEYRLPKDILQKEIDLMCANGMEIQYNTFVGRDIKLPELAKEYDAVYMALGALNAVPMRTDGSDLKGVLLGVDFLKEVVKGNKVELGKKCAIVGGGNTAIDCARTAVRLGADTTLIYRRTRKEMPAEGYEIEAAAEEGVKFHFLTNPAKLIGDENDKLKVVKLEKMELGEPDASGRRRPIASGEFFDEEFDSIIAAVSQSPEITFLGEEENFINGKPLPVSKWSTAVIDEATMYWGVENIFAGGDFQRGPATAVEAIADAKIAAKSIDNFLQNKMMAPVVSFDSKKEKKLKEMDPAYYEQFEKLEKIIMPEKPVKERITNFSEVEDDYGRESGIKEAERCLECGCQVNETCDLRRYATEYGADADAYAGSKNKHPIDASHPFILHDANKCVKCGRCVRICAETQGAGVLGFIYRGFPTYVAPEFGESLTLTSCEACGKCIEVCPVGALLPKNTNYKMNPLPGDTTVQTCGTCGNGCKISVNTMTGEVTLIEAPEVQGENLRNICYFGRFGWQAYFGEDRINNPVYQGKETIAPFTAQTLKEQSANKKLKRIYVAPDASAEEVAILKTVAERIGAEIGSLSLKPSISDKIPPGFFKKYEDLAKADAFYVVGKINTSLRSVLRNLQLQGKKLYMINDLDWGFNDLADFHANYDPQEALEHTINCYEGKPDCEPPCMDLGKKTVFIYNRDMISPKAAKLVWRLANSISDFSEGSGVMVTSAFTNTNGLIHAGIKPIQEEIADFSIYYGETPTKKSGFTVAVNQFAPENVDMVLPRPTYLEMVGTADVDGYRL